MRALCKALGLARSGLYARSKRQERKQAEQAPVVARVLALHQAKHTRHYGAPRMSRQLQQEGFALGRKRVARLMREQGLCVAPARRSPQRTTDSNHGLAVAGNVLQRRFAPGEVGQRWACDITYLRTAEGWAYLAVVLDVGSRRWLGYCVANHMRAELCLNALHMALQEQGRPPQLCHSDRGSQYASQTYKDKLDKHNITLSMSRKANCWDNAITESFFSTFKREVGDSFLNVHDANRESFDYYLFYNQKRLHSTLGYVSPCNFKNMNYGQAA